MKKIFSSLLFIFLFAFSYAQGLTPIKWSFEQEDLGNNEYNLIFKADIQDGWYLYSQFNDPMGPVPTSFTFEDKRNVKLIGTVTEKSSKVKEGYDEMFEMDIKKFAHDGVFKQKVILNGAIGKVKGFLEFMTCDDQQCLPPEMIDFDFALAKQTNAVETIKEDIKTEVVKATETVEKVVETVKEATKEVAEKTEEVIEEAAEKVEDIIEPVNNEQAILEPVKWTMKVSKLEGNKALVSFIADIDKGWGVYAQGKQMEGGPVPTTFTFDESEKIIKEEGNLAETSQHIYQGYDSMFEMDIKKFKEQVAFTKAIEITDPKGIYKGYLEFMTCDDKQCLPPAFVDFEIDLATLKTRIGEELNKEIVIDSNAGAKYKIANLDINNAVSDCGVEQTVVEEVPQDKKTLWVVFLMGLGGGLIALLTPCVFPMIPLTVSFFTKGSQGKRGLFNAFLYGFFIILVYVLLSLIFHIPGVEANILNNISTNVWINISFFLIFVFFAFSFFGYYEIELPSSMADKSSKAEGAGGVLGIFFMALTLAIVSFSCTGPILGFLIGSLASTGEAGANQLTAGMAGFGVAFALPFTLFAAFPKFLNSLPSSGGWMNTVKVVLGFIEIALALKFLSNADLVRQWGLLKYEVFIGLWIIIFLGMALYLFGKIKFPHDAPIKRLSLVRKIIGGITMAFVIYLCTTFIYDEKTQGFTTLKLLSGFPPPAGYSWIYESHCPQSFVCYHDYFEAKEVAEKEGKPMLLDFTGHACVNCRKVEETVWSVEKVHKIIDEEYILVSLYVDEDIDLPVEDQIYVEFNGKKKQLKTFGDKWAFMEDANFNQVSQPYYVLLSSDGQLLNKPIGFSSKSTYIDDYENFLKCGLEAYNSLK